MITLRAEHLIGRITLFARLYEWLQFVEEVETTKCSIIVISLVLLTALVVVWAFIALDSIDYIRKISEYIRNFRTKTNSATVRLYSSTLGFRVKYEEVAALYVSEIGTLIVAIYIE